MNKALPAHRTEMSTYAPRIVTLHIKPDKIRDVIGPGGKVIRGIVEQTGCKIDIEDDGTVLVASADGDAMEKAISIIEGITAEPEVGRTYKGTVRKIMDFGAFVEILPGTDGLLHISEVAEHRIKDVRDELKEGDQVLVKVLAVEGNRIRLSRKAILKEQRAKMGGGELPPEGGSEPTNGDVPAPALTIEGGVDFADDEPNFNRDAAPRSVVGSTGGAPGGDRDRGGDRGRGGRPGGGGRGRGRGPGRGGHGGGRGGSGGGHGGPRH
jgi:polyribonucleotide nucleotidyltransferase